MPDSGFRFVYPVPVRFHDLDAMGHAHHSLPLVYMEEARAAYWRDIAGKDGLDQIDYVIGSFSLRFIQRIHFPGVVRVGLRVSRLGKSSFSMEYELRAENGELLATGESAQVMYDYAAGASKPIPADLRNRIEGYEPQLSIQ
ncbi:MAG: thioesterase family protein [Gemmatimonadota bacterium]